MDFIQPAVTVRKAPLPDATKARRVNDACRAIGIGRSTLYKLAADDKIKLVRILGRTLVPESEIERLVKEGA